MRESTRLLHVLGIVVVVSSLFGCSAGTQSPLSPLGSQPGAPSGISSVKAGPQSARRISAYHFGYSITILNNLSPGGQSFTNGITNRGWVGGFSAVTGVINHATVWEDRRQPTDLGTLGGPNSLIGWDNKSDRGLFAGQSDTANSDPNAEDFCGNGTGDICLGFVWSGTMSALPTLGGNNGQGASANDHGTVVGWAETSIKDQSCSPPQLYDWDAFVWDKKHGIHELPAPSGDVVGAALMVNDNGDSVGASGPTCGPPSLALARHAVLWHKGKPISLTTLGGSQNNVALSINDEGEIAGYSDVTGDASSHAVLWSRQGELKDVGTLPGDTTAGFFGINNNGDAAGQSCSSGGSCRATLYDDGTLYDLNALASVSGYYLVTSSDINDEGTIAGQAVNVSSGQTVAFVAVPNHHAITKIRAVVPPALPERVRRQFRFSGIHHFGRPF